MVALYSWGAALSDKTLRELLPGPKELVEKMKKLLKGDRREQTGLRKAARARWRDAIPDCYNSDSTLYQTAEK